MNITDLIAQLSELQLEQNKILAQIAARTESTKVEPNDMIQIGDHVLLLTGGIRCIKSDKARLTKVTKTAVHFIVLHNQHNMYKRHINVQKIP